MTWRVERVRGSAAEFHRRDLPPERAVWIVEVDRPVLVLGSRQRDVAVSGIEVVRRRSGGGAVYVEPGATLWVDVVVPRNDHLWDGDVGRATYWLGDVWAQAVGHGAEIHRGPMIRAAWSDLVCFAGLGPGEVTIGGRKAVGISQRRTRDAARFQCVAYDRWTPGPLVELLAAEATDTTNVDVDELGVGVGPLGEVEAAFLAALP